MSMEYNMKPIEKTMDDAINKLKKLRLSFVSNSADVQKECPQGHGKMKKSSSGTWWCILCQRYYQ